MKIKTRDALRGTARTLDRTVKATGRVIYCNMREQPFYESMPMEPEIVLEDLIHAFHPDLLPDYQPKYYARLQ